MSALAGKLRRAFEVVAVHDADGTRRVLARLETKPDIKGNCRRLLTAQPEQVTVKTTLRN